MKFFISFDSPELKEQAIGISKDLNIELFNYSKSCQLKDFADDYFLVCSKKRLFLRKGLGKNSLPIFSDFDDWVKNYDDRLLKNSIKGLPVNFSCLDVTAGFGKDALEISKSQDCKSLVLLEKEKWTYLILQDGLNNATSLEAIDLLKKFQILHIDNMKFLESTKINFDLIYIDPMFSGVHKSKAKKHMQALRELSSSLNQTSILETSLNSANYRVVVKRHKHMNYLEGYKPSRSIEGKVVRYDIYNTN